jgi:hypothetical protein
MMMMVVVVVVVVKKKKKTRDTPAGGPQERCNASFTCSFQLEHSETDPISTCHTSHVTRHTSHAKT